MYNGVTNNKNLKSSLTNAEYKKIIIIIVCRYWIKH